MNINITGRDTAAALYLAEKAGLSVTADKDAAVLRTDEDKTFSKLETYERLSAAGLPLPERFPGGSEPYIVRPDHGRNCLGLWINEDYCEAGGAVNSGCLVEEFLSGPLYLAQVIGAPGTYHTLPLLRAVVDDRCAPQSAELAENPSLQALAVAAAECLQIQGYLCVKFVNGRIVSADDGLAGFAPRALYDLTGENILSALMK